MYDLALLAALCGLARVFELVPLHPYVVEDSTLKTRLTARMGWPLFFCFAAFSVIVVMPHRISEIGNVKVKMLEKGLLAYPDDLSHLSDLEVGSLTNKAECPHALAVNEWGMIA